MSQHPTLRRGDHGPRVAELQKLLKVRADGIFGVATERAVRAFQHAHGLQADGVCGPRTWALLTTPAPKKRPVVPVIDSHRKVPDGIDLSSNNGHVDWARITGIGFCFAKATEGHTYVDAQFAANRAGARRRAIPFGAYHFARPDNNPPEAELAQLLHVAGRPARGDLPHVLDFETNQGATQAWVAKWVQGYAQACGHKPIIYTGSTWRERLASAPSFGCPLWLAAYVPAAQMQRYVPRAWKAPTFWQWTDRGSVPGLAHVDKSVFLGSMADLKRLLVR